MDELGAIPPQRKSGDEPFHENGQLLGFSLRHFWQWSSSDLVGNTTRGIIAEYLVAQALGLAGGMRTEWDAYDLRTAEGVKIEVKSAAYVQSWHQTKPSAISFNIAETWGWEASTNTLSAERRRQADVYVFCLLHHLDQLSIDPLDVAQWTFYVLPAQVLNEQLRSQKTITLGRVRDLGARQVPYSGIAQAIKQSSEET